MSVPCVYFWECGEAMNKNQVFLLSAVCAALLSACGGGSSGSEDSATTSVSGIVADGYLKGATVCVDINSNAHCDAGEPVSAVTDAEGRYSIPDVPQDDAASSPVVAVVPETAQDSDDIQYDVNATVGSSYVLMAPAGKTGFISPLTTLVQAAMLDDPSLSANEAANRIKAAVPSLGGADLFANYIAGGENTVHDAAKVVANSLRANYDLVRPYVVEGNDADLAVVLAEVAQKALQSQGTVADPSKSVGAEDVNTLLASVLSQTGSPVATQDVTVSFDVVNDGTSIRCGDAIGLNNTKLWDHTTDTLLATPETQTTAGTMVELRFYVSNVMLWDAAGNAVPLVMTENANQSKNIALLDFGYNTGTLPEVTCTTAYNTAVSGKVAPGTYTGISMTIGVPIYSADMQTKLNHVNFADPTSPAPLQIQQVSWSWQGGRKFMKVEFHPDSNVVDKIGDATTTKWNVHLGSTGCAGDPTVVGNETACTNPNRLSLKFDAFDAATQKVVFDVAQLFGNADVTFDGGGAGGCMSGVTDPECAPILDALGLSLVNGRTLTGADAQTVFSVQ